MKTKNQLKIECLAEITAAANDINEYLRNTSVPMECYPNDINMKMEILMDNIASIFTKDN